jgi:hypothetical protein
MIDKLCPSQLTSGYDYMDFGMPMMGYGYGYGYGSKDALILRGPLAYDQYGANVNQTQKDHKFLKGLLATAGIVGLGALCLKNAKAIGTFIKDIVTKFKK